MRMKKIALAYGLVCGTAVLAGDPPKSPFMDYVYRYADEMLAKGRDTYGPQKTGLLMSAMDRTTMAPLTTRPAPPAGIRRDDRCGLPWEPLIGANPQRDENLLRILYMLTEYSTKPHYRQAADEQLKWFLENTASPATQLFPWGEHMSWNTMTDSPIHDTHEFARPWLLWDKCFELAPEASKKFALGLWEHQIANHDTGAFDRHAPYSKHGPTDGSDFPRHAGFYIRTWAVAYAHTKDDTFLKAIEALLGRYEKKRNPQNGFFEDRNGRNTVAPSSNLSLAIDCDGAARRISEPLASKLRAFAAREDELFCGLPHDLKGKKGFVIAVDKATGKSDENGLSPLWDAHYGNTTTAMMAMMCVSRYENTGNVKYRDLIHAAADAYVEISPEEDVDVWPMTFGHVIALELAAWRSSANVDYLNRARTLGEMAVKLYWQDSALPRASLKSGHYESITGADTLALSLFELHINILHITAARCPVNTLDR